MKAMRLITSFCAFGMLSLVSAGAAFAGQGIPDCLDDGGQVLGVINSDVLSWETTTADQYLARAHVKGSFVKSFADHSGHNHFSVQIGDTANQAIEIVYNYSFGQLPQLTAGDTVEVCGDYITSTGGPGDPYPVSPDSAIMHWVHRATSGRHKAGYVAVNGILYGQGSGSGN